MNKKEIWLALSRFTCLILIFTPIILGLSIELPTPPTNLIYHYNGIVAAFIALIAAGWHIGEMRFQYKKDVLFQSLNEIQASQINFVQLVTFGKLMIGGSKELISSFKDNPHLIRRKGSDIIILERLQYLEEQVTIFKPNIKLAFKIHEIIHQANKLEREISQYKKSRLYSQARVEKILSLLGSNEQEKGLIDLVEEFAALIEIEIDKSIDETALIKKTLGIKY
ncbi:MAG: hypothetical protein R3261_02575 [Alphaproteobacteria bacterium]|nr:hypothetical protein [Alphaproteobacteria bacterium]